LIIIVVLGHLSQVFGAIELVSESIEVALVTSCLGALNQLARCWCTARVESSCAHCDRVPFCVADDKRL